MQTILEANAELRRRGILLIVMMRDTPEGFGYVLFDPKQGLSQMAMAHCSAEECVIAAVEGERPMLAYNTQSQPVLGPLPVNAR